MAFPVTIDKIAAAENALGRTFPGPMRTRLAMSNGGDIFASGEIYPDGDAWRLNPVRDDSDRKRLSRSANDILRETESARQWHAFPTDGIAVASNGTGDLLILLGDGDEIWLWDHETGEVFPAKVNWSE